MVTGFHLWLERVRALLPGEQRILLNPIDPIYGFCLDWHAEGMTPEDAAHEVGKFAEAPQAAA